MTTTLRLTVLTGPHKGTRFCTRGLEACMVGRASECDMRFAGDSRDLCISRRHCQLLLDIAHVRVQDMDSANGTYINGHRVGHQDDDRAHLFATAKDGDILTIGGTSLQVSVIDCAVALGELGHDKVKKDCPIRCPQDCADQ